jgi:opacity protein-like surface antigen
MFKRIALFSLVMVLACASAFAAAPDRINKVDWGIEGGGAFPGDNLDSAGYIQTNMSYGLTEWVAIGVEGGWWEANTDAANNESIGVGQILADVILRIPTLHDQLVPYGILGLGYAGTYMQNEPSTPQQEGADNDDSSFALKIGGGLDWFVDANWILNFELAWNSNSPSLPQASTQDSDAMTVTGGVKYLF